jgi:hypothetical protein
MRLTSIRYGGTWPSLVEGRPSCCRSSSSLGNIAVVAGDGPHPAVKVEPTTRPGTRRHPDGRAIQVLVLQGLLLIPLGMLSALSSIPWHFLYFFPLPQGHG